MATISMIGLGAMGSPMARNLLKAGHELKVHDIADSAVDVLVADGARRASQKDLACNVDVVITMLRTEEVVTEVLAGDQGLFLQASENTLFIDSSTISVNTARTLSDQAVVAGVTMVDAPVSGGVPGAEAGTLTFMVGGDNEDFIRAEPILKDMGRSIVHVGPAGSGQAAKICNNLILGVSMIAVAEAFRLADKLGLDAKVLYEIVAQSSGNCWALTANHPVPGLSPSSAANNQYHPGFSSALMLKDLQLSQKAACRFGASTPLGTKATELYKAFVDGGHAELDFGAIIKQIESQERNC
ncbi:MAG: 3-hydroxyisobutyrate dehydrogenase [Phycisphaeraceae bacterium]|nr:3-hydroxyisobutyrate dehydrogenase [Phycisphaeraceae bacterium]